MADQWAVVGDVPGLVGDGEEIAEAGPPELQWREQPSQEGGEGLGVLVAAWCEAEAAVADDLGGDALQDLGGVVVG